MKLVLCVWLLCKPAHEDACTAFDVQVQVECDDMTQSVKISVLTVPSMSNTTPFSTFLGELLLETHDFAMPAGTVRRTVCCANCFNNIWFAGVA